MTGLSVLFANEAAEEQDWKGISAGGRTGRLREVYWARRAGLSTGRKKGFVSANLKWSVERGKIGRRMDDPGDHFVYLFGMAPGMDDRFEWLEVTEVYRTVPPKLIERAMRAWIGVAGKDRVEFDAFRKGLRLGCPPRAEQRRAADCVIAQVERKLAKTSYGELFEQYGCGMLVVGMPLWFAAPPYDPNERRMPLTIS